MPAAFTTTTRPSSTHDTPNENPTTTPDTHRSRTARLARQSATVARERARDYVVPRAPEEASTEAVDPAQAERAIRVDRLVKARRLPHVVTGAVGTIGTAGWAAALAVAENGGNPFIAVPLVSGGVTLAGTVAVRWRARHVISAQWRRHVWVAGTVSAIWVALQATAHGVGLAFVLLGTLLVLELVLSRGWRREYPLPIGATAEHIAEEVVEHATDDEREPECDDEPTADSVDEYDRDELIDGWAAHVGCRNGVLPSSALTDGAITPYAVSFTLQIVPGRQNIKKVKAVADDIATGLGVDAEDLMIERFRQKPGEKKDSSKLRLTVVLRSPVDKPRLFEGPKLEMGSDGLSCSAAVGSYADGEGRAFWKFWNSGGMRNGLLIGGTRSGKGGMTGILGTSARATGMLNSIYIDPQEGMSSPGLAENSTVSILGRNAAQQAIQVLEALAQNREKVSGIKQASRRRDMFDGAVPKLMPTAECPGWVVFIDECDKVFSDPKQAAAWSEFVSRCLKLGMMVIAITQYPGLTSFGLESLRSNLAQNYIALKTYSHTSGALIPGLETDPSTLPDEKPGFGLFGGGERSDVPFRGDWLPEDEDRLPEEPPMRLGPALQSYQEPQVCDMDRAVLNNVVGQPDEDGFWTLSGYAVLGQQPAGTTTTAIAGNAGGPDFSNVQPLPQIPAPLTVQPQPVLSESQSDVLALVGPRPVRTGDIEARCGLSRRHLHRVLSELSGYDLIHQPNFGWWSQGPGEQQHTETTEHEQEVV